MSEILIRPAASMVLRFLIKPAFVSLLIWPLAGVAQNDNPFYSEEPSYFDWLDKPRDYISERFVTLSTQVDRYFANERVFQESRTSYLRFYGDLVLGKSGTSNFNPQLQAKLVLPALEKRLHILLESNTDVTGQLPTASVPTQSGTPKVNAPSDFRAAVQVQVTDTPHWNINTDAGLRFHGLSLPPFVRARASRVQNVNDWQFRLTEAAYWYEQSGMGESTQYDADYRFSDHYLGRSQTQAFWSDHDQQFTFEQDFTLFNPIDDSHALSYGASIYGESQPNSHVSDYAISVTWRTRIHREWLFFNVQPGLSWPESDSFHVTPTILLRVEAIFGDLACGCYGM
jgi:hypothetical protein